MERRAAGLGALAIAVAVGGTAAFLLLRGGDDDSALAAFTAKLSERPTTLALPESLGPFGGEPTGEVFLIGQQKGVRFVRVPRKSGSSCYATADRRFGDWGIVNWVCEVGTRRFPDPEQPVLVAAAQQGVGNRLVDYLGFAGFAADPIKRIGYLDAENDLHHVADVVGNVFTTDDPPKGVKRLVGLDEKGEIIWRGPEVPLPEE